ncbi:hypothetical protein QLS71_012345 [Mariniflexile litorale]|uniref:Uncharacterized protein n=1 Tax=Mariniflexile litorale TaxID=3045158 RepID=A0AAU7EBX6_9FLAO|nr:hypothetical protein [Mariniflexile sp. KMM 9835]MDQ8210439.1 hypothetical protein [Mariniflexile sp. KMM 9835]
MAYVSSEKNIRDASKNESNGTQWAEIAHGINISINELIKTEYSDYLKVYGYEKID